MQIVHLLAGTLKLIVIDENKRVEILDPTKANSECQSVGDYPQGVRVGGAENFGNEFIVACGTRSGNLPGCYKLELGDVSSGWTHFTDLDGARRQKPLTLLCKNNDLM